MSGITQAATHAKRACEPRFWRSEALPFIEARSIENGRETCYAKHSHETFSIGAVTAGRSLYVNRHAREWTGAGAIVLMNPDDVHACNPVADERWSYRMLHVDVLWLTGLQHELGFSENHAFRAFSQTMTTDAALFSGLDRLHRILVDTHADLLRKQSAAITFFSEVQQRLNPAPLSHDHASRQLTRAAEFIAENCTRSLKLEDVCNAAGLSASHLIRAFKQRYGMTPHAYLINRRIQYSRAQLRRGRLIADVALDAGFADQAHLQRTFKRLVAATPGQYRS
ncbi:helix-turn-helix transcriptional regulator [Paraburkholderia rhynchosiae]|uniref:AraC family transcriptional regulator n=1 Tax=Paraburkholderia rhynchosiae TaxID=487049 RepID=A0A2N7WQA9_9BURK|nr:AraC family transcriptional regulator [Paraburkholderia rhynchosiae]PMS31623.1 AraC family transcriptional regulator [Paraburkholderia rhynchosiae]CAB3658971.1 HTH-type transcriptional activator RhaR [Paraburkholderia rhynchosiae]